MEDVITHVLTDVSTASTVALAQKLYEDGLSLTEYHALRRAARMSSMSGSSYSDMHELYAFIHSRASFSSNDAVT